MQSLYRYFEAKVYTIRVHGPLGLGLREARHQKPLDVDIKQKDPDVQLEVSSVWRHTSRSAWIRTGFGGSGLLVRSVAHDSGPSRIEPL